MLQIIGQHINRDQGITTTTQQSPECFCLLVSNSTVFIVSPHPYFNIFAHFFTRKELVHKCWFSKLHPLVSPKCMHIVPFKNILDHVFFSPGLHKKIMRNRHQEKVWQNTQTRKLLSCACVDLLWSPCPHWPCCRSSCCPVFTRPKPSLHWAETGRPLLYNRAQHQLAVLPPSTSPLLNTATSSSPEKLSWSTYNKASTASSISTILKNYIFTEIWKLS